MIGWEERKDFSAEQASAVWQSKYRRSSLIRRSIEMSLYASRTVSVYPLVAGINTRSRAPSEAEGLSTRSSSLERCNIARSLFEAFD